MKRKVGLCITLLFLLGMILAGKKLSELAVNGETKVESPLVVIDAGHGGEDPGKVGIGGVLEKDINLDIAKKLRNHMEEQGLRVIMTRTEDISEASKLEDMKKRVELINENKPLIVVSIHQNSYSDASIKGAQVFYYTESKESQKAAQIVQEELRILEPQNNRQAKAERQFYMLKKTKVPTIIVECGFLSNKEDTEKLVKEDYQEKISQAICNGIIKWLAK